MHLVSSQTARHKYKLVDHVGRQSDKPTEQTNRPTDRRTDKQADGQIGQTNILHIWMDLDYPTLPGQILFI